MDNDAPIEPRRSPVRSEATPWRLPRILASATLLAAAVMAAALITAGQAGRLSPAFLLHDADHLSSSQQQARLEAFNAVTALPVAVVEPKEEAGALASMQLSAAAREALVADLHQRTLDVAIPAASPATVASSATAVAVQAPLARPEHGGQPRAIPVTASAGRTGRLIWLTLWDTDDEDGDVVRIQSQGYSRVVMLTREPMTFAVPAADAGVIDIVGMRDGEGGGITVGVASGPSRLTLPIMSVGQIIGLRTGAR